MVEMDSAKEMSEEVEDPAMSVEICQCPEGYTGSSCQLCEPGFFTNRTDKWGPICQKCNCNGHADTCHPTTGECVTLEPMPYVILNPGVDIDQFCHFNPAECEQNTDKEVCSKLFQCIQFNFHDPYLYLLEICGAIAPLFLGCASHSWLC